MEAAKLLA